MIIRMPIDTKSLYCNIKNDNQTGHTPTVSTPLKQGKSVHSELAQIMQIPENISSADKERLSEHLLRNSRASAKIIKTFVFDSISVNHTPVQILSSYCIYIREETDKNNFHYGRQKVHYPQVLEFSEGDVCVDNRAVLKEISNTLHNYAFVVVAFEYNDETKVLNFDAMIVGNEHIPYSKVFLNKRGVGSKFTAVFSELADNYDTEIIAMRKHYGYSNVSPENYLSVLASSKQKAISVVRDILEKETGKTARIITDLYPYSPYDIEMPYRARKYIVVCFTATHLRYFNLSNVCIRFIQDFSESVELFLVTKVHDAPEVFRYTPSDLSTLTKIITSVSFEDRGVGNE